MGHNAQDRFRNKLARDFSTAYISNQLRVTFKTAENYTPDEVGDLWLLLADVAIKSVHEIQAEFISKHFKEPETVSDLEN